MRGAAPVLRRDRAVRPGGVVANVLVSGAGRQPRDDAGVRSRLVHDDVAGQEQPNLELGVERAVGERRIAGTQNDVFAERAIQLFLQRLPDVNRREYAEALVLERVCRSSHGGAVRKRNGDLDAVSRVLHIAS